MQKVAFFDIDGTVFRSSLLVELVEALVREGVFPKDAQKMYQSAYTDWVNREGTYETYIEGVVVSFMKHMRGVFYGDIADIGQKVVEEQGKHVYRYTRDLISDLKQDNYFIVAVSQSPKFILDDFCDSLGFDKVYGRMYELGPQDRFTGEVIDQELITNKALIIDRVLDRNKVHLEDSVGVGDTESDIPLLSKVENPICFNPNSKLYAQALREGWKIVVERKDVIYTL